ncbi:MAG: hypothetical protein JW709_03505, partial [Sedimentisphaerales bacterium]|nr:hypothetical protein [Sedimentisphaerales bacterium]
MRIHQRLIIMLLLGLVGAAAGEESPFLVDVALGWGNHYRPMEWTPVNVTIQSRSSEPFSGRLILSGAQDGLNTLNIVHEVVLTPGVPQHVPLVTKLAYNLEQFRVRLEDSDGNVKWRFTYDIYDPSFSATNLTEVEGDEFFIGVIGRQQFGILNLKDALCSNVPGGVGEVIVTNMPILYAPWDWTGYAALDVLMLFDPDWSALNKDQSLAIRQWVTKGGKLLVVLGANPMGQNHPLRAWLPVAFDRPGQIKPDWAYLADLNLDHTDDVEINCYHLSQRTADVSLDNTFLVDNTCVYAAAPMGFGRVAVLGFNPGELGPRQRAVSGVFWLGRLQPLLRPVSNDNTKSGVAETVTTLERSLTLLTDEYKEKDHHYYFETGFDQQAANQVMGHLYTIPELRPLSLGWVILMLGLLAVLLGPVDYFFLKHRDKLPLTWLTMTGWIALFTITAYYGVEALRGGNLQVRAVSMIDASDDASDAWRTTYTGIFAPHSDDYHLDDMEKKGWWSGIAPSEDEIYYHNRNIAIRNIDCLQHDGGNLPFSLPINIWSMQTLIREDSLTRVPLRVDVARRNDNISVTITNLADQPLTRGYVLFD